MTDLEAAIFIHHRMEAEIQRVLFRLLAAPLVTDGYVAENYSEELLKREKDFPTGLSVPGGVAIPHTDATFVQRDAITFATLKEPVVFGLMGANEHEAVPVSIVILLALADGKKHLQVLQQLVAAIQDGQFTRGLIEAAHRKGMNRIIREKFLERTT